MLSSGRRITVAIIVVLLGLSGSAGAAGVRDYAVGAATGVPGAFGTDSIRISAHATKQGAKGAMLLVRRGTPQGTVRVRAAVECIAVSGNLARVSGTITRTTSALFPVGSDLTFEIQDNGAPGGGTRDAFSFGTNGDCTAVAGSFGTVTRGNLHVYDAP
jgi:hypothetical protein